MAKTTQMAKMNVFGKRFSVVFYSDGRTNPFYLYETYNAFTADGHANKRRRLLDRYGNFESCLYHLLQLKMQEFTRDVFPKEN